MISLDNARKWTKEAADHRFAKQLEKWIVRIGDDWVQTFRDKMTEAMVDAVREGLYNASVEIASPTYASFEGHDEWQEFIRPDLEKLLLEYEALGFQDGASEAAGVERNTLFSGSYNVTVNWGYRKYRGQRVKYA